MKALLINGGPHERGCTYTALKEVADTLEKNGVETEIFWIGNEALHGCIACGKCREIGKCVFDDVVNVARKKFNECDALVVGSPVYYAHASGQVTAFLDRLFYSTPGKERACKLGASVVSCRRGGASAAFDQLNKYFTISNMPVVSSQYWNQVHGLEAEDVLKDEEGLQTMRTLGQNIAWLLKCIEAGKNAGIEKPVYEPGIGTNFIRRHDCR